MVGSTIANPSTSTAPGLITFDLITPDAPVVAGTAASDTALGALAVEGTHVIALRETSVPRGIERFDVAQIGRPRSLGGFDLPQDRAGLT